MCTGYSICCIACGFSQADLLLLSTSEPNSLCYIETAELDGQVFLTNLLHNQLNPVRHLASYILHAVWSAIGIILSSVHPSVCDVVHCAWLKNTSYSKSARISEWKVPLSSQTPHLLNRRRWCHLANQFKLYCEQGTRQHFHIWNSHRQHAARLFQTTLYDRLIHSNNCASC